MDKYNPKKIEEKWQKYWEKHPELYVAEDKPGKEKKYILDMFPYPSGEGLHVGHVESFTATDIISRYLRMNGKNVLHPTGWDAFGLPAENYAIKVKTHPSVTTRKAIDNFRRQMKMMGFSYDWEREVDTTNADYYKWTQWFFLLLYKNELAYKKKAKANWCNFCQTVLANEQVISGMCERCGNPVVQKDLEQWFFKITDFIEDKDKTNGLLNGTDKVDWPESTKLAQKNWIGRSEGAIIKFPLVIASEAKPAYRTGRQSRNVKNELANNGIASVPSLPRNDINLEVFTTRLDTIYGCTYCVVAPEHKLIEELKEHVENYREIKEYQEKSKKKSDLMRMEAKEKTGVKIKGIKAINPFTNKEIPLYVADYVLVQYGTGAVMAVPAHDERDLEFAQKYGLSVAQSITSNYEDYKQSLKVLEVLKKICEEAEKRNLNFWISSGLACAFYARMIYRKLGDIDIAVKDRKNQEKFAKFLEETGFRKIKDNKVSEKYINYVYQDENEIEVDLGVYLDDLELGKRGLKNTKKELEGCKTFVLSKHFNKELKERLTKARGNEKDSIDLEYLSGKAYTDDGFLVNSEKYSGLTSEKAREKMAEWLEKNNLGKRKINYKLRDWLISRQRYWGAPIPIIYCDKCGAVPVPEKDLPVTLPNDIDFKPTGESPLVNSKEFHNVKCPKCGGKARRESDTTDTFVCSSWYYFRYADPKNEKEFASKKLINKWLPVDLYVGGAEHTVLHLLYSRFFTKVLHHLGYIDFDEPFLKLRHQGIILGPDGQKMSKSKGNVINPDDEVKKWGADTLRLFEMFLGSLEDMKPWDTKGIVGCYRFLEKVYKLKSKVHPVKSTAEAVVAKGEFNRVKNSKLNSLTHKTIKKVSEDIENLRFNTAISALMILTKELDKEKELPVADYKLLVTLLSPLAPFVAEELWEKLGHKESIFKESWPKFDPKLIKDEKIELVIQINGKIRDKIEADAGISENEAKRMAMESEKIKVFLTDKKIRKVIFVKGRLINIVI
jgi:leucyl-tRNA synthetase